MHQPNWATKGGLWGQTSSSKFCRQPFLYKRSRRQAPTRFAALCAAAPALLDLRDSCSLAALLLPLVDHHVDLCGALQRHRRSAEAFRACRRVGAQGRGHRLQPLCGPQHLRRRAGRRLRCHGLPGDRCGRSCAHHQRHGELFSPVVPGPSVWMVRRTIQHPCVRDFETI